MTGSALILETRGSVTVAACSCCGRFCSAEGGTVLHASHCDGGKRSERWVPAAAVPEVAPVAHAATTIDVGLPLNTVGNGAPEDKWHAVNSRNPKDWDRAMNRDD